MRKNKKSVLLPSYLIPERYKIVLHPDLDKCTFNVQETVYFELKKATNELIFHAVDLRVNEASLLFGENKIKASKTVYDPKNETVKFIFSKKISKGKFELLLNFDGFITNKMCGFYQSSYVVGEEKKILAVTQFESTDARRAFVCVDQPAAKAIFDITFVVPADKNVVSNTYITDTKVHDNGYKIVSFAPTPKMSTYLVAFIVGDLEHLEKKTEDGVLVRVFVTPGKNHQAQFALDTACKILTFYNKYFGIKYPLPLLDMIAIPDFAAGAMENWGAVTYRETALLIDPTHSSASAKQRVALVIAHELAHQWFGNLATMQWWTHLWLNEGFASWIEYLAVDHVFPEWDIWTQFVVDDYGRAMELDALKNTHPVEVEVGHPHEISEIFDAISYSKGASIINMLYSYIGAKSFQKGLQNYLKKHQYSNASTGDLWTAFEKASGKPVKKIMSGWTSKPGYPVVSVLENRGRLVLKQKRFFSNGNTMKREKQSSSWKIPMLLDNSSKLRPELLEKGSISLDIKIKDWLNLNASQRGFYRLLYDRVLLEKLVAPIKDKKIDASNRIGILNDAFAMSKAGLCQIDEVLPLLSSYKQETNYTVWKNLALIMDEVDNLLWGTKHYEQFQKFASLIYEDIVKNVGWDKKSTDGHTGALLRELVLAQSGKYGNEDVIKKAKEMFSDHVSGKKYVDPDLRVVVYGLVAKNGGEDEYNKMMSLYDKETMSEEKNRLAIGLCKFKQKELISRTLEFIFSPKVRSQDAPILMIAIGANNSAHDTAWEFLKKNWKTVYERYKDGHFLMGRFVSGVANDFKTEEKAKDIEFFFKKNPAPAIARTVAQSVEQIRAKAFWFKNSQKGLDRFFK